MKCRVAPVEQQMRRFLGNLDLAGVVARKDIHASGCMHPSFISLSGSCDIAVTKTIQLKCQGRTTRALPTPVARFSRTACMIGLLPTLPELMDGSRCR